MIGGAAGYGIQSAAESLLGGLRESGYYDEMLNPSMGHDRYYAGEIQSIAVDQIPEKAVVNFVGGKANPTIYTEENILFRVSSPGSEFRHWWLTEPPMGKLQWRIDNAVPPEWGNTAEKVSVMKIPSGETLNGWSGPAEYQGGIYVGQRNQVYLPRVPEAWVQTFDFQEFLSLWK